MNAPYQKRLGLAGLATMNGSSHKSANNVLRSPRQRRRAFEKEQDKLIVAAWRKWGDLENMPLDAHVELQEKIDRLQTDFGLA